VRGTVGHISRGVVCGKDQTLVVTFLTDSTNGRTIGTVLPPSVVCNVMYCG